MKSNIGIAVAQPSRTCNDKKCPFHGHVTVRGQVLTGKVVSTNMIRTATIVRTIRRFNKKYERYITRFRKYHAHVPECIDIRVGDEVKIAESRKLAKTVSFIVVEKVVR